MALVSATMITLHRDRQPLPRARSQKVRGVGYPISLLDFGAHQSNSYGTSIDHWRSPLFAAGCSSTRTRQHQGRSSKLSICFTQWIQKEIFRWPFFMKNPRNYTTAWDVHVVQGLAITSMCTTHAVSAILRKFSGQVQRCGICFAPFRVAVTGHNK